VDSALIIAGMTVIAYCAAFAFDAGYLSVFGVPLVVARVDIKSLLLCAGFAGMFMFVLVHTLAVFWPRKKHPVVQQAIADVLFAYGVLLLVAVVVGSKRAVVYLSAAAVLYTTYKLVLPLLFHRDKSTYAEKLMAMQVAKPAVREHGFWDVVAAATPSREVRQFVLGLIVSVFAAHTIGLVAGATQSEFLVARNQKPPCAVLREHGDRMCVRSSTRKPGK
jgi:hypothetical protein